MKKSIEDNAKQDKVSWSDLIFTEGGFSVMILFPLVVLYFLSMAISTI